jgi:RNA polymerase sigma-70 factor, ECF subfamily
MLWSVGLQKDSVFCPLSGMWPVKRRGFGSDRSHLSRQSTTAPAPASQRTSFSVPALPHCSPRFAGKRYASVESPQVTFPLPPLVLRCQPVEADVELLGRLRSGDEDAFVALVDRYQHPMLRLARSFVPSLAVAEEAVQDTWMGVVRGIHGFEGRSSLKTWLFRIVVNRARSAGSREPANAPLESVHSVDPSRFDSGGHWAHPLERWTDEADDRLDAATWVPFLAAALNDLPPRQRQVVLLRDVEGLSNQEACSVLGISAGNQRILLHRGRARLRGMLENNMKRN